VKILLAIIPLLVLAGCTPRIECVEVPVPYAVNQTVIEYVKVPEPYAVEKIVYEVVTVNRTVEVEVIKEVESLVFTDNLSEWLIPWESVYEIRQWLASDNISEREYVKGVYDCEDFAIDTCLAALKARRLIIPFAENYATKHGNVLGLAFVGNNAYLIYPQYPNGRPEYWGKKD